VHINDYILEPVKKISFKFSCREKRWFYQTNRHRTLHDSNVQIRESIQSASPLMITRLGTSELHTVLNFLSSELPMQQKLKLYFTGQYPEFWCGQYFKRDIVYNSGFFPSTKEKLNQFAALYINEFKNIDIILSWLEGEHWLYNSRNISGQVKKIHLYDCEPYFTDNPWTLALKHLNILVIHPFADSIQNQYSKRNQLFKNQVLPEFNLITLKAHQTLPGNNLPFATWFEALDELKDRITNIDFDVALIGAGAYGLPLASFIKNLGKKAIHLGGFLQIIFGIRGNRWEGSTKHKALVNEHWKFPYPEEYPVNYNKLDHGSYWGK